jgi:hypothetical protein
MPAGDMAHGVGHGQHRQTESERYADEPDSQFRERGGEDGAAATAKDEPKGAEKFGPEFA